MPAKDRSDQMRQEIIEHLRTQLEALADVCGLTDAQLAVCYQRQERVRELRHQLSVAEKMSEKMSEKMAENWEAAEQATLPRQASTSLPGNREAAVAGL
jgi:hypothetical protein